MSDSPHCSSGELSLSFTESPSTVSAALDVPPPSTRARVIDKPLRALPGLSRRALLDWLIDDVFKRIFRPLIASENVWRWADQHVVLSGAGTGRGGPYVSSRTPWTRRFQESFTDPSCREHHVMKCSRSGYTEAALNIVRFMPEHSPGPVHFAAGSEKKTAEINKDRLTPSLKALGIFAADATDPDDITARMIRLGNMVIRITGSYTEGSFRADGNRVEILDEVELVNEIKNAGTIHDLGRSRIRGVEGARLFTLSKPLNWNSAHHREVVTGTLEAALVPCPHCGAYQELSVDGKSFTHQLRIEDPDRPGAPPISPKLACEPALLGHLVFDSCRDLYGAWDHGRVLTETYYECVSGCKIHQDALAAPILEANPTASESFSPEVHDLLREGRPLTCKQAMVLSLRWFATNPRPIPAPGGGPRSKRSSHISDLYSLDYDMTWGHFASIFLQAAHDPAKLRACTNEHFGMPFRERVAAVSDQNLVDCRAPYERGTLPWSPDYVVFCADTQDAWWKYVVAAGRLDSAGQAWRDIAVVRWGTAIMKSDVLAELRRPILVAPDLRESHVPAFGLIDAGGHRTDEVYELHFDSQFIIFPSYGRDDRMAELRPTWQKPISEAWRGCTFNICWFWDDFWKRRMYLGSMKKVGEIKHCQDVDQLDPSAKNLPPRLWLPGLPADDKLREFSKELQSERLTSEGEWKKMDGPNDFGDALKMCYAAFDFRLPLARMERDRRRALEAGVIAAKP